MSKTRDDYTAKIKLELDEFNAKMEILESKAKEAKEEAREKYRSEMLKLRHHSDLAVAKLEQLRTSGEDSWDKLVQEMEKLRNAFMHSLNYFKSQF
jgi:predicted  nucleic acid-binding Zn-ribbon protein